MPHRLSVHVVPRESGWAVMREGSERATSVHPTQAEAAKEAREIARARSGNRAGGSADFGEGGIESEQAARTAVAALLAQPLIKNRLHCEQLLVRERDLRLLWSR